MYWSDIAQKPYTHHFWNANGVGVAAGVRPAVEQASCPADENAAKK